MLRAQQRLMIVVPITLLIIVLIIYLNTRSLVGTAIIMLSVPLALVGSFWLLYLYGYNLSVAVWIGLIALAGVSAETGVVMLLYLDLAYDQWKREGKMRNAGDLRDAIYYGAVKRVRPKGDDCRGHYRGPGTNSVESWRRRRRDEAHRYANDRRHRYLHNYGAACFPGDLFHLALARTKRFRARSSERRGSWGLSKSHIAPV